MTVTRNKTRDAKKSIQKRQGSRVLKKNTLVSCMAFHDEHLTLGLEENNLNTMIHQVEGNSHMPALVVYITLKASTLCANCRFSMKVQIELSKSTQCTPIPAFNISKH